MEEKLEQLSREELFRENQELRAEKKELERRLTFDDMTGLYRITDEGRRVILNCISAIHAAGEKVGLVRMDLDRMRKLNDRFGHDRVDRMLREVGNHLKEKAENIGGIAMRCYDKGDEFEILAPVENKEKLQVISDTLTAIEIKMGAEQETPRKMIRLSFTVGIAHEDEPEVQRVLREVGHEPLEEAGRLFTALSGVADIREVGKKREKKK